MLTLLGSLLGFASSTFPELLKLWRDRADRKHELAILERKIQAQTQGNTQRLEEIQVQADRDRADFKHELAMLERKIEAQQTQGNTQRPEEIKVQADMTESEARDAPASQPNGAKWVEALRASVRPTITYAFFILFATVKITVLFELLGQGVGTAEALTKIWDDHTQALFAAVMSFWFGQRALDKFRSNR